MDFFRRRSSVFISVVKLSLLQKNFSNVKPVKLKHWAKLVRARKMSIPKSRENPIIMKLDTAEYRSIFTDELCRLIEIFKKYKYEIRVAGGAVRDLLLGKKPKDLDFATTATPDQMKQMFAKEDVRMINEKGEKHGTVTPRINDKANFEVTTLRIDVITDGRHAQVQFTTEWLLDASRRDLTINSMYLDFEGNVYDYFFGYEDLKKKRVVFVGNEVIRIQEDYLRILRYFRFYGRIVDEPDRHEQKILDAIASNVNGLEHVSGERIWMELKQILEGNFAGELLLNIVNVGAGPYIGLPDVPDVDESKTVWARSKDLKMQAITLLSSLLKTPDDVLKLHNRLKFSAYERDLAFFIVAHRGPKRNDRNPLLPYKQIVVKAKGKSSDVFDWVIEVLKYEHSLPLLDEFKIWKIPRFPIGGLALKERGIEGGRFMGLVLNELKSLWADNDFNLNADQLLEALPQILKALGERRQRKS